MNNSQLVPKRKLFKATQSNQNDRHMNLSEDLNKGNSKLINMRSTISHKVVFVVSIEQRALLKKDRTRSGVLKWKLVTNETSDRHQRHITFDYDCVRTYNDWMSIINQQKSSSRVKVPGNSFITSTCYPITESMQARSKMKGE